MESYESSARARSMAKHSHMPTLPYSSAKWKLCVTGDYTQMPRRREVGLLDEGAREILRCAQDDKPLAVILSAAKDLDLTILKFARERLQPAAWLISVGFGIPTSQHFVTRYL